MWGEVSAALLGYVLRGIGFGFAAAMQPGPFQTYVISETLGNGWRRTLPAALAPLVSDGPIIALVLLVISQVPAWLEQALQVAGGLFILALAVSAFKAWRAFDAGAMALEPSAGQSLLKAGLMNALSPGPYVFWTLVGGPILLAGWREAPALGISFLVGFYGAMVACLMGLILLFGIARGMGPKVTRALLGASAIALAGFGLYQLWQGLAPFPWATNNER